MSAVQADSSGWRAELRLHFVARGASTYLSERRHIGPLMIQRPFYPEPNVCHAYIVHPPGGVVGGDELHIHVDVDRDANVLLTTPAAAKFYRSTGAIARQTQSIVAHGGNVEWLPQESIYYRDARVRSDTRIGLGGDSHFVGWEIACLGLPAREEAFDCGELRLGFDLQIDGTPRVLDRLRIEGSSTVRTAPWGLAGHTAIGTLLAFPANRTMVEQVREIASRGADLSVSLVDDVLVCRCLGAQAEPVRRALIEVWKTLRPLLLGRSASLPRIWAT